ncbi:MAG TPA: RcpC/CpaB family pilus assembly protein, partial [Solirubrobacter sp.]
GRQVDVIASYGAEDGDPATKKKAKPNRSIVIVPGARVIAVGSPRPKAANNAQDAQQDPGQVVPVTFALSKEQELRVAHAQVFAADVRLALLRRGDPAGRTLKETIFKGQDPKKGDEGVITP